MPIIVRDYYAQQIQTMKDIGRHNRWWTAPINFGGVGGPGGGSGVPPGNIFGLLIQTKVAFDTSEAAYSGILTNVPSGSLVDNLAHMRFTTSGLDDRVTILETTSGISGIEIQKDDVIIETAATVLNFEGDPVSVINEGAGKVTVTISGTGAAAAPFLACYILEDLTSQVPASGNMYFLSNAPILSGSTAVHLNGLLQQPNNYIEDSVAGKITVLFDPIAGDELVVHYCVLSGEAGCYFLDDLTSQVPASGNIFTLTQKPVVSGTVVLHLNGLMQQPDNYTVDADAGLVTVLFDAIAGDELVAHYCPANTGLGGVIDHGDLLGLADDDHPQYLLHRDQIKVHPSGGITITSGTHVDPGLDVFEIFHDVIMHINLDIDGILTVFNLATIEELNVNADATFDGSLEHFGSFPAEFGAGLTTVLDTTNVSNPPTDAEIDAIFGTPTEGFIGLIDDAGLETDVWLIVGTFSSWFYQKLTKAV